VAQFAAPQAQAPTALPAPIPMAQEAFTLRDPAEFRDYQMASTQYDPKVKTAALERFLQSYPQSIAKSAVLDSLIDIYVGLQDADKTLDAASRQLQVDPNNGKAIYFSVYVKKVQCAKTSDAQTCDAAAALARKGLAVAKPASTSPEDWKKLTGETYPAFHSAIALDDIISKKDVKAGIAEYRTELALYPPDQTKSGPGLWDTLQLAEAYTKPEAKDLAKAVWLYARAWNFSAASMKDQIESKLEYYYKKHHGNLDGLHEMKVWAIATIFPPDTSLIPPEATPSEAVVQAESVVESAPLQQQPAEVQTRLPAPQEAPAAAKPPAPEVPEWPVNEKPAAAAITWDSQGLRIEAANSSLQQIMTDVATVTGTKVEGLDADQRVFGAFGPGPARDVLSQLLQGSGYNVLMIGDQGQGTPREIVLSSRNAAATPAVAGQPSPGEEDVEPEEQPQEPQPIRPGFGPGGQRGPRQLTPDQQRQQHQRPGQPPDNSQPQ
jgi:hypothetical protein